MAPPLSLTYLERQIGNMWTLERTSTKVVKNDATFLYIKAVIDYRT